jgi:hypothetical protein
MLAAFDPELQAIQFAGMINGVLSGSLRNEWEILENE